MTETLTAPAFQIPTPKPKPESDKRLLKILFFSSVILFCITIIGLSLYVTSLHCENMIYIMQSNGSTYGLCDQQNIQKAQGVINYCEQLENMTCFLPEGCP
jgi:hypothetical protein